MCLKDRARLFPSHEVVTSMVDRLEKGATERGCVVPVSCSCPTIATSWSKGLMDESDSLAAMYRFSTLTGKLLHSPGLQEWQQSFWDHVMRIGDDGWNHATELALNPVRAD